MKTKIWTKIIIDGFKIKHKELTKILGIEPTNAGDAGDICYYPKGQSYILKKSYWELESDCDKYEDFETHVEYILFKLRPYKESFKKICEKYPLFLSIYIHTSEDECSPYIAWGNNIMKELAEYNAEWGIDLSIYKAGEDDE